MKRKRKRRRKPSNPPLWIESDVKKRVAWLVGWLVGWLERACQRTRRRMGIVGPLPSFYAGSLTLLTGFCARKKKSPADADADGSAECIRRPRDGRLSPLLFSRSPPRLSRLFAFQHLSLTQNGRWPLHILLAFRFIYFRYFSVYLLNFH